MVARIHGTIENVDGDSMTIRVECNPGFSKGERVNVQVEKAVDDWPERMKRLENLFGVWKDDEEIGRIFDEILEERHKRLPRDIEL